MANELIDDKDDDKGSPIEVVEGKQPGSTLSLKDQRDDDDHDDDADDRVTKADDDDDSTDTDREEIRERRRQEKKDRKLRQEEAKNRSQKELKFLQQRNEQLERQFSALDLRQRQGELTDIDKHIQEAAYRYRQAEHVHAAAITANNGADATAAMRYRDQAAADIRQLQQVKAQQAAEFQRVAQAANAPPQPDILPPEQIKLARKFIEKHSWYDLQGGDEDSKIVNAIDSSLMAEGMDPASSEYWSEMESRMRRRLPEKFQRQQSRNDHDDGDDDRRPARTPTGGPQLSGGRASGGSSGRQQVYISPERKQAMMDANVWDDAKLREKYIRKYMEYDKANGSRR
jgi:hypothetical protein